MCKPILSKIADIATQKLYRWRPIDKTTDQLLDIIDDMNYQLYIITDICRTELYTNNKDIWNGITNQ